MTNYKKYIRPFVSNTNTALVITSIFTAFLNFIFQYKDNVDYCIKHFNISVRYIDLFTFLFLFGPVLFVFFITLIVLHFVTLKETSKKLNRSAEISQIDVYYKINYDTNQTLVSRKVKYSATSKTTGIFTIPPKNDGTISDLKYFEMSDGIEIDIVHTAIPNKFGTEIYKLDVSIAEESTSTIIEKYKLENGFKSSKRFDLVIVNLSEEIEACHIKVDIVSTRKISSAKWLMGNRNDDNNTDEGNIELTNESNSYVLAKEFEKDKLRVGISCAIKWIFEYGNG